MTSSAKIILIALALVFTSCGKSDDDKKNSGDGSDNLNLSPSELLTAEWAGIYRRVENGKPAGDALPLKVFFYANRSFLIVMDHDADARVEGEWSEFQGNTLIMRLKVSTISTIGAAGKVIEPGFELVGSSLRINAETFEMKLNRKSDQTTPEAPGTPDGFFVGNWTCDDGRGRTTRIDLKSGGAFRLSTRRGSERVFVASGPVTNVSPEAITLKPDATSEPLAADSMFEMAKLADKAALTLRSSTDTAPRLFGTCSK